MSAMQGMDMNDDASVTISRAANGYVVCFSDPDILAANKKDGKYDSADVEMVFPDIASVLKFLDNNLEKIVQEDEYSTAFMKALKE